ncbi:hypothetical protein FUA23_19400 [Neolewinella aurantiaca]|uniref:PKD domain-containing protein n=1 Tax=Neolewinella aurantiaca TaxID=2602767 RepID=A0A5C7F7J2_9BACT|nr:SwmB domain-containing protein [Neolewinella aurantiaca]TXF86671.1 hypothetical protein FUA23_19400 [Neolewinella aurantiaca]
MKKLLFLGLVLTAFLAGCEKEFVVPNDLADVQVLLGTRARDANNIPYVAINDYLPFADVSQGVISHSWSIEEGNFLLTDGITTNDSVYTEFIIPNLLETEETTVNVLFARPGLQTVRLRNVFDRQVNFETTGTTAVREGDNWVIDTTYLVDVFDDLKPAFRIMNGDEEVISVSSEDQPDMDDSGSWPEVTLEVGQSLTFVDLSSSGRPTGRRWQLNGGTPAGSTDSVATISYPSLGEHTGGTFRLIRGGDLAPPQTVDKVIPVRVTVIPSSEPFVFTGDLIETEDDVIAFRISGEAASFSGQEEDFTVHVTNGDFDQDIAVQTARVNTADATMIELVLAEPVYNTDTVTVTYAGGTITSLDNRTLEAFGPERLSFGQAANALISDVWDFETGGTGWFYQHPQFEVTTDMAFSGSGSLRFFTDDAANAPGNMKCQSTVTDAEFNFPAGSYDMSFRIWIAPDTEVSKINTNFSAPFLAVVWDLTGVARGEWVEVSQTLDIDAMDSAAGSKIVFGTRKADISSATATYYIDALSISARELRP